MSRRSFKANVKTFVKFLGFVLIVILLFKGWNKTSDEIVARKKSRVDPASITISADVQYRKYHIEKLCKQNFTRYNGYRNETYLKNSVFSDKYKFVMCLVAKNGCTFFKRLFHYLSGLKNISSPFNITLSGAHAVPQNKTDHLNKTQLEKVLREYQLALFVRNPYKRIFSGYVDKIFSRYDYWSGYSKRMIKNHRPSASSKALECGTDATLTDLIRFMVWELSKGHYLNDHFMPIYHQCNPCSVKYDFIGTLETFKTDAKYLFEKLHIDYHVFIDQTEMAAVTDELKDAAEIVMHNVNRDLFKENPCFDIHNFTRRIWRKLQIKGLISNTFDFPLTKQQLLSLNITQFLSLLTIYNHKSSTDPDLHRNRKLSYLEAFYSVPQKDLENLAQILSSECELWGYPNRPEVIFNPKKRIATGSFNYFNFDDV